MPKEPYDFRSLMHYSASTDPDDPNRHTMTYVGTNDLVEKPSGPELETSLFLQKNLVKFNCRIVLKISKSF